MTPSVRASGTISSARLHRPHISPPAARSDNGPGRRPDHDGDELPAKLVEELVERARQGDSAAFGQLYDRFHAPIYRSLYAKTHSRVLAEDLAAETFAKALDAIPRYKSDSRYFGAWLGTIAKNLVIDHFKSTRARHELLVDDLTRPFPGVPSATPEVMCHLGDDELKQALWQLPPNQRRCLELRYVQDLSIAETAERLRVTHGAAKQLQWRGLRNLERLLGRRKSA